MPGDPGRSTVTTAGEHADWSISRFSTTPVVGHRDICPLPGGTAVKSSQQARATGALQTGLYGSAGLLLRGHYRWTGSVAITQVVTYPISAAFVASGSDAVCIYATLN
ncbi:hypothetical protein KCP71_02875 [Salmonella enterica subsp. enterica]|nr:hypothetical protein KCP71_02875 [Salmonella enterica subsp. enterica]